MDNSIWSILDVIFVGAGVYVLYAWVLLKTKGEDVYKRQPVQWETAICRRPSSRKASIVF